MNLSLQEFDRQQFNEGSGERLYDADQVDAFLAVVRESLKESYRAVHELTEANPRLSNSKASIDILKNAQEVGDKYIAEATAAAEQMVATAAQEATEIKEATDAELAQKRAEKETVQGEIDGLVAYGDSLRDGLLTYVGEISQAVSNYSIGGTVASSSTQTDEAPVAEEVVADEAPVAEEVVADEAPVAEEVVTDEAPVAEEVVADEAPVAEEAPEFTSDVVSDDSDELLMENEAPVAEEAVAEEAPSAHSNDFEDFDLDDNEDFDNEGVTTVSVDDTLEEIDLDDDDSLPEFDDNLDGGDFDDALGIDLDDEGDNK